MRDTPTIATSTAPHAHIRHHVLVLSGKGGVGKSTVAVNLAIALQMAGQRVGLLDVDIHGPSIPTMLGLEGTRLRGTEELLQPVEHDGLRVMSLGFMLTDQDDAVIWRGPLKMKLIRQFLEQVAWGDLDVLVIDAPPGTGDEPLSVCQVLGAVSGAVIVTTPQKVAAVDVRKAITFCRTLQVPVLGVVENMSGFVCPTCGTRTAIFPAGSAARMAREMHVPFLGAIPIDPRIAAAGDEGRAFVRQPGAGPAADIMRSIMQPVLALDTPDAVSH